MRKVHLIPKERSYGDFTNFYSVQQTAGSNKICKEGLKFSMPLNSPCPSSPTLSIKQRTNLDPVRRRCQWAGRELECKQLGKAENSQHGSFPFNRRDLMFDLPSSPPIRLSSSEKRMRRPHLSTWQNLGWAPGTRGRDLQAWWDIKKRINTLKRKS